MNNLIPTPAVVVIGMVVIISLFLFAIMTEILQKETSKRKELESEIEKLKCQNKFLKEKIRNSQPDNGWLTGYLERNHS